MPTQYQHILDRFFFFSKLFWIQIIEISLANMEGIPTNNSTLPNISFNYSLGLSLLSSIA